MHRPPTPEAEVTLAEELSVVRPSLSASYAAALPGARAAVLTRLWRALAYEPMPWVARREAGRDGLTLRLADGRRLHGPRADPYATAAYVTEVRLDGTWHDRPDRLLTALAVPHAASFAAELGNSVASLALSRAGQPAADQGPVAGWEWEQRVVDGHPYHPNCRSRPGFSVAEQLAYGPEHRPLVELGLVASDDCLVTGEWPKWLRDGERVLIPVHPWQTAHVLGGPGQEKTGAAGDSGEGSFGEGGFSKGGSGEDGLRQEGFVAHPLMSLRTLALPDGPHVKTALSARLTSSVRDISVYSIETAATVSAFMEAMAERPDVPLHITRTLGAATANSPDLAAVLRESPDMYANSGERVVPVAALATTGLPQSPAWMAEFTHLALTAGLRLLDLGVALEAHGQNLLVVLSPTGTPLRLVYRDLADIRISPARLARHGIPVPDLAGRIVTDDVTTLRRKLFGALVGGTLGATAGSTAALREALETVVPDLPDSPDLAAFRNEPLPTKALTLMRLSPETPGDTWAQLPNPLLNSSL
ncbi:IucA/IucC family protein [Streptomyces sp. NPDC058470]|uniref:IucA/IucC family protein n=1 Tax=Streptomyces sp. NPDC058470 TaxID=3346515 RepID=UPI003668CA43